MSWDNLQLSARALGDESGTYRAIEALGLRASVSARGGTGAADDPARLLVRVENPAPQSWTGVVHLEYPFPGGEPRFWLPGFLYGRNRGRCPCGRTPGSPVCARARPSSPRPPGEWCVGTSSPTPRCSPWRTGGSTASAPAPSMCMRAKASSNGSRGWRKNWHSTRASPAPCKTAASAIRWAMSTPPGTSSSPTTWQSASPWGTRHHSRRRARGGRAAALPPPGAVRMSSTVAAELRYYLSCREDAYVARRLEDMVRWSCQTYNHFDREFDYGRTGWMSERFCYSEGLLTERYPDGAPASTWFALMPWACGSVLEGLLRG